jgi:hypothetical protein
MKRSPFCWAVVFAIALLSGTVLAAPATGQGGRDVQADPVWPLVSPFEWYWHTPNENLSQAQIDSSMTGLTSGMFTVVGTNFKGPMTGVSVNRKRIQFNYKLPAGPTWSSFPVKQLESVRMYYASSQPSGQKWLVVINLSAQAVIQVYFETEANGRAFIDAAASVAKMEGVALKDIEKRGFVVSDLTPAQIQALGKSRVENALVTTIAYGGPAEQAGLRLLDLITEVDGVKIRNADHLMSILDAAAPGTLLSLTCLERAEEVRNGVPTSAWKPKTVTWKSGRRP